MDGPAGGGTSGAVSRPPLESGRCPFHGLPRSAESPCPKCAAERVRAEEDGARNVHVAKRVAALAAGLLAVGVVATTTRGCWQERAIEAAMPDARARVRVLCFGERSFVLRGPRLMVAPELAPAVAWLKAHRIEHSVHGPEAGEWQRVRQLHPHARAPLCVTGSFLPVKDLTPAALESAVDAAAREIAEMHMGLDVHVEPHPFRSVPGFLAAALSIGATVLVYPDLPGGLRAAAIAAIAILVVVPSVVPSIPLAVVAQILLALVGVGLLVLHRASGGDLR